MEPITISVQVHAPILRAWEAFTLPEHIQAWNHATDDWRCPRAENNVHAGGTFSIRMEAKDGSEGFDFEGTYKEVIPGQELAYVMSDGRHVLVTFVEENGVTTVTETFDPEAENPIEMQRAGWQAILDNYKVYTEKLP